MSNEPYIPIPVEAAQYKVQIEEAEKEIRSLKSILAKHWVCLKSITEAAGIDESTSVNLSIPGHVIGEYTLAQILEDGAVAFRVVKHEASVRKEGEQPS